MNGTDIQAILQFERGELTGQAAAYWQARVEQDQEARDWLAWARALRSTRWPQEGSDTAAAPDPMDIAALAQGRLDPIEARSVREQLLACEDGMGMLAAAMEECAVRGLQPELDEEAPAVAPLPVSEAAIPPPQRGLRRVLMLAAGLFAMVWAGRQLWQAAPPAGHAHLALAALAERQALPTPRLRSSAAQGLDLYGQGLWLDAAEALRSASNDDLDNEAAGGPVWLYMGSALLMAGEGLRALEALEEAYARCEGSYAPEAAWQLTQARLLAGDEEGARALLVELEGSRRHTSATLLLERLGNRASE